jgi:hypothetical protein
VQVSTNDARHFASQSRISLPSAVTSYSIFLFACLIVPSPVFLFCVLTWLCFVFSLKVLVSISLYILLWFSLPLLLPGRDDVFLRSFAWDGR